MEQIFNQHYLNLALHIFFMGRLFFFLFFRARTFAKINVLDTKCMKIIAQKQKIVYKCFMAMSFFFFFFFFTQTLTFYSSAVPSFSVDFLRVVQSRLFHSFVTLISFEL